MKNNTHKRIHCSECSKTRDFKFQIKDNVGRWYICTHCKKKSAAFVGGK